MSCWRRAPLEVRTDDPVVPAPLYLAIGDEKTREGVSDLVPDPADRHEGPEVLVGEVGAVRSREDDAPSPLVFGHESRVGSAPELARDARAPSGRRDGPGVHGLDRSRKEIDSLQEEGALLGIEEGEALVYRELGHVGFHLREVGVDRAVEGRDGVRRPLHVESAVQLDGLVDERAPEAVPRHAFLLRGDVRRDDEIAAAGKPLEPRERVRVADEAVLVARQLRREHLVAEIARVVAVEKDVPLLDFGLGIAERGERDADLELPALLRDLARGFPVVVGRRVLAAAVVGHGVVLDAARSREKENGVLRLAFRVQDEPTVVGGGARDVVPVREGRTDLRGIRVGEQEARVEELVVVGEVPDVLQLGGKVVARIRLVPRLHARRALPAGVIEVSVDEDRPGGSGGVDFRALRRFTPGGIPGVDQK